MSPWYLRSRVRGRASTAGNTTISRHGAARWRRVVALAGALAALGGCASILGIDDTKLVSTDAGNGDDGGALDGGEGDADAEALSPTADQCATYCSTVEEGCSADSSLASFRLAGYCPDVCAHFVLAGDPTLEDGNNYECRLDQASRAQRLVNAPGEGVTNCQQAGPGGGGKCGTNCEGYCQLYTSICADYAPDKDCLEHCPKLREDNKLNATSAFGSMGDTLQCRLAHLAAAAVDPEIHCAHATLNPDSATPCNPATPSCLDYCNIVTNTCDTDQSRQYDSLAECMGVCDRGLVKSLPLEPGTARDIDRNTVACRKYHAYNALVSGEDHCNHAGPGGDGHCGKVCPAFCDLAAAACSNNGFAAAFVDAAGCLANCAQLVGTAVIEDQEDYKYNVSKGKVGGNNISCRLYNVVKAFADPAGACPSVLGAGLCKP